MFERIDHVGIIVGDIDSALAVYAESFELELVHREVKDELGLDIALLTVGESRVELLALTSPDSVLAGAEPGIHHVAYGVADIDTALELLGARDVDLLDTSPRVGVLDSRIAFVHPHAVGGVLTELVEEARS